MKIVLDPGHGGRDPGAVDGIDPAEGEYIHTREADLALILAILLRPLLGSNEVVLTREADVTLPLASRVALANQEQADLFVSLHFNAAKNTAARGIETLYHTSGKRLAELIQAQLVKELGGVDRGVKRRTDLYVLKHTNCPAVLVELGFLTNPESEVKLNSVSYLTMAARAIAQAVNLYIKERGED